MHMDQLNAISVNILKVLRIFQKFLMRKSWHNVGHMCTFFSINSKRHTELYLQKLSLVDGHVPLKEYFKYHFLKTVVKQSVIPYEFLKVCHFLKFVIIYNY